MMINPEFQRNIWLEFTYHRLVAAPLLSAAIYFLIYLATDARFWEVTQGVALALIILITLLWGIRLSSEAVSSEIKDQTWDGQRMSAIGPWDLTWGKLLGSTLFTWYVAGVSLILFFISGWVLDQGDILLKTLVLILAGLFAQAVALFLSLSAIRKDRNLSRTLSTVMYAAVVVLGGLTLAAAIRNTDGIGWYGQQYDPLAFMSAALAVWLVWATIGVYRYMRTELQHRNGPWVWVAFVIFAAVFVAGFIEDRQMDPATRMSVKLFTTYINLLFVSYVLVLSERRDPIQFRRIFQHFRLKQFKRFGEELPCWAITLVLLILYAGWYVFSDYSQFAYGTGRINIDNFVLATFLFLLRDLGIILFFSISLTAKRKDTTAILYLIVLYFLAPSIFAAMKLDWLRVVLLPHTETSILLTAVSGGVQLSIVAWLLFRRWRQYFQGLSAGSAPALSKN